MNIVLSAVTSYSCDCRLMEEQRGQMSLWLHEHSRSSPDDDIVATVTEELSVVSVVVVAVVSMHHAFSKRTMCC